MYFLHNKRIFTLIRLEYHLVIMKSTKGSLLRLTKHFRMYINSLSFKLHFFYERAVTTNGLDTLCLSE